MRRIVVCDTGPSLQLGEANIINLLHLAGEIIIPSAVSKEFEHHASGIKLPDWVTIKELEEPYKKKALAWKKQID